MKYDIAMIVGGLPFDSNTVNNTALGGSETAGYYMAKALAKAGHVVKLFCECQQIHYADGVQYIPLTMAKNFTQNIPADILIVQRDPSYFAGFHNSKVNILWNHDLSLGRNESLYKSLSWNIDKYLVLSEFMKDQYKKAMNISDSLLHVTRNGIDLDLIKSIPEQKRNLKHLVYAARPERGLDVLLEHIMPKLLAVNPEYKLFIAGYDNPKSELGAFYGYCNQLADKLGDAVVRVGQLPKSELYKLYKSCGAYIYPTPSPINNGFAEISCITAMEAQACGLPFIASDKGALIETVNNKAGILIDGNPISNEYINDFLHAVLNVTSNVDYNNEMSKAGIIAAEKLDWQPVAEEWTQLFDSIISEKNNNPERLIRHFYKNSDAIMAMHVSEKHEKYDLLESIRKEYSFLESAEKFSEHYTQGDNSEIYTNDHVLMHRETTRYKELHSFIELNKNKIKTVMDYGCSGGGFTINLSNDFPDIKFVGVDLNRKVIERAIESSKNISNNKHNISFIHVDELFDSDVFDLVICQEVLEHVEKPWLLINKLEKYLFEDGMFYITVPYGPWESDSFNLTSNRFHVWHFDQHDLNDMLKSKRDVSIRGIVAGTSERYGLPVGWWQAVYIKNNSKTFEIDLERKAKLQAPIQTVSAVMMAGPSSEDQLNWCLKSIKDNIDELIIVDNGMSDEAIEIARKYNAIIIKGLDPKVHGFEAPRNIGVEKATMDFILWIDTDEKLLGGNNLTKYLRTNYFDGYSIKQHHFACDTTFPADMPVRLFRNHRGIRFYGMIHEHPEKGVNQGPGDVIVLSDVSIAHTGYLTENIRRNRFARNFPMLQADCEKYPDRLLQKHFLMRDNMLLVQYELQQNGGQVTNDIISRCNLTVSLYNEFFKSQKNLAHIDSLQWYTMALQVLNRGVDVKCDLTINGENVGFNGRFESMDHAKIEMNHILENTAGKYEKEYY